ncbi:MAG: hypothetical protein AB7F75_05395, partial [Planctomycetota bacterium]
MFLAVGLAFGGFCFWHSGHVTAMVNAAETKFSAIKTDLARLAGAEPDEGGPGLARPGIDKKLIGTFSETHTATYNIPTSPSSGFENLGELVIQEGKQTNYRPSFVDPEIKKAFQKLNSSDISIAVKPEGVINWILGADGSSVDISALKFGEATLTFRDKTLKGAHVKIRVKQSLKILAFVPENSVQAVPDATDLNLNRVTWNAAKVSHTDLAGIGSYTLQRQSLKTAEPS